MCLRSIQYTYWSNDISLTMSIGFSFFKNMFKFYPFSQFFFLNHILLKMVFLQDASLFNQGIGSFLFPSLNHEFPKRMMTGFVWELDTS